MGEQVQTLQQRQNRKQLTDFAAVVSVPVNRIYIKNASQINICANQIEN